MNYALERAKLTMEWRKSRLERMAVLKARTNGAGVAGELFEQIKYEYEMARLDYYEQIQKSQSSLELNDQKPIVGVVE